MPAAVENMSPGSSMRPAKKQSKWSPEEDALIIELRGGGMKWEDISTRLPGRSAISCRLHYQNYLEKRISWDDERKTKLALVYERLKPQMWAKVAEELQVPWRAAEAMHWKLGESEIARRTGATPFSLTASGQAETLNKTAMTRAPVHQQPHPHPQPHPHSQEGMGRERYRSPQSAYDQIPPGVPITVIPRRESLPPPPQSGPSRPQSTRSVQTMSISAPPTASATPPPLAPLGTLQPEVNYELGRGLAPIHSQPPPRIPGPLPSISELTTGLQLRRDMEASGRPEVLYSSVKWTDPVGPSSHMDYQHHQQQQHLQHQQYDSPRSKRRASPEGMTRESLQRRRVT